MNSPNLQPLQLSHEEILEESESNYMNADQLAFFRKKLLALYESTCARIQEAREQISNPVCSSDANDRASSEEQSSIALRIVDR